jgi:hypothetical protein
MTATGMCRQVLPTVTHHGPSFFTKKIPNEILQRFVVTLRSKFKTPQIIKPDGT